MSDSLDLWDYRRRVDEIYARVRRGGAGEATWRGWVEDRDSLFANHPQSPIEDRAAFTGLAYFDHDPAWRLQGVFTPIEEESAVLEHSGAGSTGFVRIGTVAITAPAGEASIDVLWLDAYGGGLFLPFRDQTNGTSTYGGGRYLLDTVKGADLGHDDDRIVLDFNYAYHPSCVHSYRWSCPLAPPQNRLPFPVETGERLVT
jgi:uncharacterized protein (DUF1684 family)